MSIAAFRVVPLQKRDYQRLGPSQLEGYPLPSSVTDKATLFPSLVSCPQFFFFLLFPLYNDQTLGGCILLRLTLLGPLITRRAQPASSGLVLLLSSCPDFLPAIPTFFLLFTFAIQPDALSPTRVPLCGLLAIAFAIPSIVQYGT